MATWQVSPGGSKGRSSPRVGGGVGETPQRAGGRHRDGAPQQATGGVSRQQLWSRPAPWSRWPGRSGQRGLRYRTQRPPTPGLLRLRSSSSCAVSGPYVLHSRDTCRPAHRTPTRQDGFVPQRAKSQTGFRVFTNSVGGVAPVDQVVGARAERSLIGTKEGDQVGYLLSLTQPSDRVHAGDHFQGLVVEVVR